ncbi:ATP-binding cassette domain-containing protein [Salinibacterium sp. ZJ450]|uniref:ABC transporter ATP-binding protein/permease n=1 Tax=Salinibacterium sp. ZJ450 TaxID=2708338 RepID=UPI0014216CEC|nr:ABC transporter ATP-binding protein/permease [Salinibacterium sp. ZJ450]
MPLIDLRGVSRVYGATEAPVHALVDVYLRVDPGEFLAIIGPSGGGKTTLLSIIGALDTPTSGEYLLDGVAVPREEGRELAALRAGTFGYIFQSFHLLDQRPASDSVELGMLYQGVGAKERAARAAEATEHIGMRDRLGTRAALLSGGQRQRLAIARAIASRAPVLLADEPTGNLDSATGARVMAELTRLHRQGVTVIVVTHDAEVAAAASRVVRITDGRLTEERRQAIEPSTRTGPTAQAASAPARRRRVRFGDLLADALASLRSRTRQSLALAGTVALAVALLVTTLGLDASTRAQVTSTFDAHASREVSVQWEPEDAASGAPAPVEAVTAASTLAGVESAAVVSGYLESAISNGSTARTGQVHEAAGDLASALRAELRWARDDGAGLPRAGEALVGASLADQLELGPLIARPQIAIAGTPFTVVGIIDTSNRAPLLAGGVVLGDGQAPAELTAQNRTLFIRTGAGAALQVGRQLPVALDPYSPDAYVVQAPTDPTTLRAEVQSGVRVALLAFTGLAAMIAVLTLINAIGSAITARRAELGLRRALGARRADLIGLVVAESAILGAAGGVLGLAAGFAGILGFTVANRWLPVFDVALAPLAIVAGVAIGALASIVGAVRASRVHPAEALRQ